MHQNFLFPVVAVDAMVTSNPKDKRCGECPQVASGGLDKECLRIGNRLIPRVVHHVDLGAEEQGYDRPDAPDQRDTSSTLLEPSIQSRLPFAHFGPVIHRLSI